MRTTPMLSIIVPVYNKEKYLCNSLESLLNQTFTDSEIIVINDGSTDKSADIIKAYQLKCDRIKLIEQKNAGASAARNRGIEAATGKYIIMLDADDSIEKNMHEKLVECAEKHQADLTVCNYHVVTTNNRVEKSIYDYPYDVLIDREYIEKEIIPNSLCIKSRKKAINAHWILLFKRSVLEDNNVRYNELHRKEEDKPFIMTCLKYVNNIVFVKDCLYNYNKLGDTLINQYSPRFQNLIRNFRLYEELYSDIFDFKGKLWGDFFVKIYEECIGYVIIHRKNVESVKKEIMSIITDSKSIEMFSIVDDRYETLRNLYASKNYKGVYKYYLRKYRKLRVKTFLRDLYKR